MSELAARHLMKQGAGSLMIANRTHERAVTLAQKFDGHVIRFEDLHARADEADILITSTGSPEFLFRTPHAQQFLQRRKNRPMLVIDIAVPRDIDPEVNRLEGIFLYDIDDLQSVATSNLADRGAEARRAEKIVEQELARYQRRVGALDVVPALVDLQSAAEEIRQAELRRNNAHLRDLTAEQQELVDSITRGLMNKFLHQPLQMLKAAARSGDAARVEAIRAAFLREAREDADAGDGVSAESDSEIQGGDAKSLLSKK